MVVHCCGFLLSLFTEQSRQRYRNSFFFVAYMFFFITVGVRAVKQGEICISISHWDINKMQYAMSGSLNDSMRITWKNITEVEQIQSGSLNIFIPIHESKRVGQLATNGGNSFLAFELRNEFITIPNNHNPIPCCSNIS